MDNLLQSVSLGDIVTGLLSLIGVMASAFFGYLLSVKKVGVETKTQAQIASKTAEQEFRDDLIKQLEDSSARLDRVLQRLDDREKRIADLVSQIDSYWTDRATMKSDVATLTAELAAERRKTKDLMTELEKFERKVFYIAPKSEENK